MASKKAAEAAPSPEFTRFCAHDKARAEAAAMHEPDPDPDPTTTPKPVPLVLWRSERFAVVSHGDDLFLVRRVTDNLSQVMLLKPQVAVQYDVWLGGRHDECECGRAACRHIGIVEVARNAN